MFETVTKGFKAARNYLAGQTELTDENTTQALRDVRLSLLEADVEFNVVKTFLARVREKTAGATVTTRTKDNQGQKMKLGPADHFVKICYDELVALMGPVDTSIRMSRPVGSIMMVGLQGTGKTTTTGKLAKYLKEKKKLKPLLVAADIYRPAAVDQLRVVGERVGVPVYHEEGISPPELCKRGLQKARELKCDIVLFDTAGRLAIDDALMEELVEIKKLTTPDNIFLVVDAMMGQDAVRTSVEFNRKLSIDGFLMTKLDGDARGGAALSIKEITGTPIKFLGMGEHLDELEEFRPDGLASRILGMGDIVGLVQQFEQHIDKDKAEKDAMRMLQGRFTLQDFLEQMRMIKKMGSLQSIMEKIPGMSDLIPEGQSIDDGEFTKLEAMVLSMTPYERKNPDIIEKQKTRRARIAKGSGRTEQEVSELVERFTMMRQMMQMIGMQPGLMGGKGPNLRQMAQMAKNMRGGFPGMGGGGMGGFPSGFPGMGGMGGGMPNMGDLSALFGGGGKNSPASNLLAGKVGAGKNANNKKKKKK